MFYEIKVNDFVRVPPSLFGEQIKDAITERIKKAYEGHIAKEIGIVVDIISVDEVGEGKIIPGDGAAYYNTSFTLLTFRPENQEIVTGKIKDIADFGAFINMGVIDGMIHISQTMDDYVSFSKEKVLSGKETNQTLHVTDLCKARVVAVSYKDMDSPKIGLTMRQQGLGRPEWIEEVKKKKAATEIKKETKKETKKK